MKETRNCKIIQDLLPAYIDNLTTTETNTFIEEHLQSCSECHKILDMIQKESGADVTVQNKEEEINYIKKYNKKYNKVKYALAILIWTLIIIFCVFYGRKIIIFKNITNKISNYKGYKNYYLCEYFYHGKFADVTEIWVKDEKMRQNFCGELSLLLKDDTVYNYIGEDNIEVIPLTDDAKAETLDKNGGLKNIYWYTLQSYEDELNNLANVFLYSLKDSLVNGKNCYQITTNDQKILYIDKENGLLIRVIFLDGDNHQSVIYDYEMDFNCVTDEIFEI